MIIFSSTVELGLHWNWLIFEAVGTFEVFSY